MKTNFVILPHLHVSFVFLREILGLAIAGHLVDSSAADQPLLSHNLKQKRGNDHTS